MTGGSGRRRGGIALVAALLFALQSLFAAVALGASAAAAPLDAYGNPLCVGGSSPDHDNGAPAKLPPCCLPGCLMAGGASAPPPQAFTLAAPVPVVLDISRGAARAVRPVSVPRISGGPRAPPQAA